MANLVVLSEINCIAYLQKHGIVPSEFYTDFELFKNHAVSFSDTVVLCLFAGTCRFSKRRVLEYCGVLRKRMESEYDKGIKDVVVLSDTVLPTCSDYYLYNNTPIKCAKFKKWKSVGSLVNLTDVLSGANFDTKTDIYLLPNDFGINDEALARVRTKSEYELQLREKIRAPKVEAVF